MRQEKPCYFFCVAVEQGVAANYFGVGEPSNVMMTFACLLEYHTIPQTTQTRNLQVVKMRKSAPQNQGKQTHEFP
jgi:hypothetical protein